MSPLPRAAAGGTEAFLGVERSALGHRWEGRLDAKGRNLALALAQRNGLPEIVARVLAARGATLENVDTFLTPRMRDLMPDPFRMTDCEAATQRLAKAVAARERVAVFGDYDVDGAASSALLAQVLRELGCETEIYIPDRITEGYGPNVPAVRQLRERGASLLVTVDCGTMSHEAIDVANRIGLDVIVLDHHQQGDTLPSALAVVNPNRDDDLSGLGYLCATGVVFMALVGLRRALARTDFPDLLGLLDLVALATVCDMVPLRALNRAFVVQGLNVLNAGRNVGLRSLAQSARMSGIMKAGDLGYLLGPRINAGGRVGDAGLGARLLCERDVDRAAEIAARLEGYNRERQAIEANVLADAVAEAEHEMRGDPPPVIVTASQGWHPGVVGLVASRLKDRFNRPAFAIGFDGSGRGSGSGRSIPALDLGRLVREATKEGLLLKGGGHAMAAGLTIDRERLGAFRAFIERRAEGVIHRDHVAVREVDGALGAGGASLELVEELERAGPFGMGQPKPVFVFPAQTIVDCRTVGRNHLAIRLRDEDGAGLRGIAFRALGTPLGDLLQGAVGSQVHLCGTLDRDDYRGRASVGLRIEDAAPAR